jgi:hypothetical protein
LCHPLEKQFFVAAAKMKVHFNIPLPILKPLFLGQSIGDSEETQHSIDVGRRFLTGVIGTDIGCGFALKSFVCLGEGSEYLDVALLGFLRNKQDNLLGKKLVSQRLEHNHCPLIFE